MTFDLTDPNTPVTRHSVPDWNFPEGANAFVQRTWPGAVGEIFAATCSWTVTENDTRKVVADASFIGRENRWLVVVLLPEEAQTEPEETPFWTEIGAITVSDATIKAAQVIVRAVRRFAARAGLNLESPAASTTPEGKLRLIWNYQEANVILYVGEDLAAVNSVVNVPGYPSSNSVVTSSDAVQILVSSLAGLGPEG